MIATITLDESELKAFLAKHMEVQPKDVTIKVTAGYDDGPGRSSPARVEAVINIDASRLKAGL